jgi:hypothetical protein
MLNISRKSYMPDVDENGNRHKIQIYYVINVRIPKKRNALSPYRYIMLILTQFFKRQKLKIWNNWRNNPDLFILLPSIAVIVLIIRSQLVKKQLNDLKLDQTNEEIQHVFNDIQSSFAHNYCPAIPQGLGKYSAKLEKFTQKIIPLFSKNASFAKKRAGWNFAVNLKQGGHWEPTSCRARHKVAIVVTYKNRKTNLMVFLMNMHPLFQNQELSYTVFVVEQVNEAPFNKGILMNAAFREIMITNTTKFTFDCLVFHDVDLIPTGWFFSIC